MTPYGVVHRHWSNALLAWHTSVASVLAFCIREVGADSFRGAKSKTRVIHCHVDDHQFCPLTLDLNVEFLGLNVEVVVGLRSDLADPSARVTQFQVGNLKEIIRIIF